MTCPPGNASTDLMPPKLIANSRQLVTGRDPVLSASAAAARAAAKAAGRVAAVAAAELAVAGEVPEEAVEGAGAVGLSEGADAAVLLAPARRKP